MIHGKLGNGVIVIRKPEPRCACGGRRILMFSAYKQPVDNANVRDMAEALGIVDHKTKK